MMNLRKRIFFIVSLVVLAIFGVVIVVLLQRPSGDVTEFDPNQPDPTTDADAAFLDGTLDLPPVVGNPEEISPILANEDADERYVRQVAIDFVERFGSFSNQNRNNHIQDVLPLVTDSMETWVGTQLVSYNDQYTGSTSKVIVSRMEEYSVTTALVHIEAQQALETGDTVERIYNVGTIKLVLQVDGWKVDGLFWE